MIKSKLILFFKEEGFNKDEKNAFTLTKLEKFNKNQEFKTIKNKSLTILELHIMNLTIQ